MQETCDDHLDSVRSYAKSVGVDVGSMAGWSVSCTHGEKGRKDYMYHPPAPAKAINSRVKVNSPSRVHVAVYRNFIIACILYISTNV